MPRALRVALTCTIAVLALVACTASPSPAPPAEVEDGLFRGPQPWTADVWGAPASERARRSSPH